MPRDYACERRILRDPPLHHPSSPACYLNPRPVLALDDVDAGWCPSKPPEAEGFEKVMMSITSSGWLYTNTCSPGTRAGWPTIDDGTQGKSARSANSYRAHALPCIPECQDGPSYLCLYRNHAVILLQYCSKQDDWKFRPFRAQKSRNAGVSSSKRFWTPAIDWPIRVPPTIAKNVDSKTTAPSSPTATFGSSPAHRKNKGKKN